MDLDLLRTLVSIGFGWWSQFGADMSSVTHELVSVGLRWPSWILVAFMTVALALVGSILHVPLMHLNYHWSSGDASTDHSEIAGHFLGAIGVIYAVLLAFVVVTTWQQFDHAEEVWMQEQTDVANIFDVAGAYRPWHPRESDDIRVLTRQYAADVLSEGRQMQRGEPLCLYTNFENEKQLACQPDDSKRPYGTLPASRLSNDILPVLRDKLIRVRPRDPAEQSIYQQSIILFSDLMSTRDHLRHHYAEPMQSIMWVAFAVGGLVMIGLPYVGQGRRNSTRQYIRTLALCILIGLVIGLTLVFDHPFTGSVANDRLTQTCSVLERFDLELTAEITRAHGCPSYTLDGR